MNVCFRKNENWDFLTFSVEDLKYLTNETITKEFELKYGDEAKEQFDIVDIKQSSIINEYGVTTHYITVCYAII